MIAINYNAGGKQTYVSHSNWPDLSYNYNARYHIQRTLGLRRSFETRIAVESAELNIQTLKGTFQKEKKLIYCCR